MWIKNKFSDMASAFKEDKLYYVLSSLLGAFFIYLIFSYFYDTKILKENVQVGVTCTIVETHYVSGKATGPSIDRVKTKECGELRVYYPEWKKVIICGEYIVDIQGDERVRKFGKNWERIS